MEFQENSLSEEIKAPATVMELQEGAVRRKVREMTTRCVRWPEWSLDVQCNNYCPLNFQCYFVFRPVVVLPPDKESSPSSIRYFSCVCLSREEECCFGQLPSDE